MHNYLYSMFENYLCLLNSDSKLFPEVNDLPMNLPFIPMKVYLVITYKACERLDCISLVYPSVEYDLYQVIQ